MGLFCHLVSVEDAFYKEKNLSITFQIMMMFPLLGFVLFLIARYDLQNTFKNIIFKQYKSCIGRGNEEQDDFFSSVNSLSVHQVLIEPIALSGDNNHNNYGSVR